MQDNSKMKQVSDQLIPVMEQMLGVKLNYTPQSLKAIEAYYSSRTTKNEQVKWSIDVALAFYFGEVIVRNIKNAEWTESESAEDMKVTIPTTEGHSVAFPLRRILRFQENQEYGLYPYYSMIQDMSKNRINLDSPEIGGKDFVGTPRGYQMRSIRVSNELRQKFENGEIDQAEMIRLAKEEQGITD